MLGNTCPLTLNILTLPTNEGRYWHNWKSPGSRAVLRGIAHRIFETATGQPSNLLRTVAIGSHHLATDNGVGNNSSVHFFVQGQVHMLGMLYQKLQTFQVSRKELNKERTSEVDALGSDLALDVDQYVRIGAEDGDVLETEGDGEYEYESDD